VTVEAGLLRDAWSFFQRPACVWQPVELRHFSPVTQRDRNGAVGVTRRHERRDDQLAFDWLAAGFLFANCDLYQIAGKHTELLCISRTNQCRVVPSKLGYRIG